MHLARTKTSTQDASAKELFEIVWSTLSEVIGTAATASVIRRSVRQAIERGAALDGLMVERRGFKHHYTLPASWAEPGEAGLEPFRVWMTELLSVINTLTGPVLARRLATRAELRQAGLFAASEEP